MVLLKAEDFASRGQSTEVFSLRDVAEEAAAMIEAARCERENMLAETKVESQSILEQARVEGHRAGREQGLTEGRQEGHEQALNESREQFEKDSNDLRKALNSTWAEFDQAKDDLLWRAEQGTVALAIAIADKITKTSAVNCHDIAGENVKAALDLIAKTTNVIVKMNPKDIEHLEKTAGESDAVFGKHNNVNFETDEEVEPGGCRLCTEHGEVDAQLDTQIQRIADELLMSTDGDSK